MRTCAYCGEPCDAQVGIARSLQTQYWGGKTGQKVEYSERIVSFFCSDNHRNQFLATGSIAGEIQTDRWLISGED